VVRTLAPEIAGSARHALDRVSEVATLSAVLSTRDMRREWSEYECNSRDWATISFLDRSPVKTIRRLIDAWSAAERVLIDAGYGKAGDPR
jgi:hypothetical protein